MKRILALGAALLAFGLFGTLARAADGVVSVSTSFDFRLDLVDPNDDDSNAFDADAAPRFYFDNPEVVVSGDRVTDMGLETGFEIQLQVTNSGAVDNNTDNVRLAGSPEQGEVTVVTEEVHGHINGGFGSFVMGYEDGAADRLSVGADFVAVGIANNSNTKYDSGDAMKVTYYAPALGPVSLGVSLVQPYRLRNADDLDAGQGGDAEAQAMTPNPDAGIAGNRIQDGGERATTDFAIEFGVKAEVAIVTFGLGWFSGQELNADEDQGGITAGVALDLGAIDVATSVSLPTNTDDSGMQVGLGVAWGSGPIGVSLTVVSKMASDEAEGADDSADGSAGVRTDQLYADGEVIAGSGELSDLSQEDAETDLTLDLNATYVITDGVTFKLAAYTNGDDADQNEGLRLTVGLGFSF